MTCANCGAALTYSGRGRPPRFCQAACKTAFRTAQERAAAAEERGERRCANCPALIPAEAPWGTKYCSRRCGDQWRNTPRAEVRQARRFHRSRHHPAAVTAAQYEAALATQDGDCVICRLRAVAACLERTLARA